MSEFIWNWREGVIEKDVQDPSNNNWSILFVGDLCPAGKFEKVFANNSPESIFDELYDEIKSSDFSVFNLETPLTITKNSIPKYTILKSHPSSIKAIKSSGFNVACLSNNHILDYGKEGLIETIDILKENNIHWVGVGINRTEAEKPLILNLGNLKIGIINFSESEMANVMNKGYGASDISNIHLDEYVNSLKKETDVIISIFHGGKEYVPLPLPHVYELFERLANLGVNLIIGHHPHVPQGIIEKKGTILSFSLGNFIFDFPSHKNQHYTDQSYALKAYFKGKILTKTQIIPYKIIPEKGIKLLKDKNKSSFLDDLKSLSDLLKDKNVIDSHSKILAEKNLKNKSFIYMAAMMINVSSENFISLCRNIFRFLGWIVFRRKSKNKDTAELRNILDNPTHYNLIKEGLRNKTSENGTKMNTDSENKVRILLEEWNIV